MTDDSSAPAKIDAKRVQWRKTSYSTVGECVELAAWNGLIAVRNSNNPDGGTLFLDREELSAWLAGIKAGEFDDLT